MKKVHGIHFNLMKINHPLQILFSKKLFNLKGLGAIYCAVDMKAPIHFSPKVMNEGQGLIRALRY